MSKKYEKPTLYHKCRTGAIFSWKVWAENGKTFTEYGQIDGEKQISSKDCFIKNEGKTNQTSIKEQSIKEVEALYLFKLERKYSISPKDAENELFLPMLAHDFNKRKTKITYPLYIQRKYDGVRMLCHYDNGEVNNISRSGKEYIIPTIMCELERFYAELKDNNLILDGEVYLHEAGFQNIMKLVKKIRSESENLEYHIYDVPSEKPFSQRLNDLNKIKITINNLKLDHLKVVDTECANVEKDIYNAQKRYTEEGYEGAIVRLSDGKYEFGYRSPSLLKVKVFDDAEYEIIDVVCGNGKYKDLGIFVCKTNKNQPFNVNPKGTFEDKAEFLKNKKNYIGKMLKVKYFEKTDDGIPRFPVGLGIRLEED